VPEIKILIDLTLKPKNLNFFPENLGFFPALLACDNSLLSDRPIDPTDRLHALLLWRGLSR